MILGILCFAFIAYMLLRLKIARANRIHSAGDLFTASRSLGILGVSMSLIATQIGGGTIIGTAEEAYINGISGIFYTGGLALGFLVLGIIGAKKLRSMEVGTVSEIFEKYYGSTFLRKLSSILSIAALFGITIGQIIASRKIFALTGFEPYLSTLFWGITILYIATSGMNAIASMSKVQSAIMYSVFGSILILILKELNLSEVYSDPIAKIQNDSSQLCANLSTLLVPFLFCLIEQDIAQSFFSAKSGKVARYGALLGGVLLVLFGLIPLTIGLAAQKYEFINGSVLSGFIAANTPEYFSILSNFGILMAIVSTANSLICAISSSITLDFFSSKLKTGKIVTLVIGISAIILGQQSNNLLSIFIESYRILVCSIFAPIFITYFNLSCIKLSKLGAILAVSGGIISYIVCQIYSIGYLEVYCLLSQFVLYIIGMILDNKNCCKITKHS
jgi:solute:Na+ symporter, SSS family